MSPPRRLRLALSVLAAAAAFGLAACDDEEVERGVDEGAKEAEQAGRDAKKAGEDAAREAKQGAREAERELEE
jgi:uncharacterized protein YgiB involved in biofilm formation